ncbi:MAG: hypothetical protein HGB34_04310 [Candidatus Moranbacteria bacterium]|nr:hypothetical protein [Candidatus Moranbacteria bacterium]
MSERFHSYQDSNAGAHFVSRKNRKAVPIPSRTTVRREVKENPARPTIG